MGALYSNATPFGADETLKVWNSSPAQVSRLQALPTGCVVTAIKLSFSGLQRISDSA